MTSTLRALANALPATYDPAAAAELPAIQRALAESYQLLAVRIGAGDYYDADKVSRDRVLAWCAAVAREVSR